MRDAIIASLVYAATRNSFGRSVTLDEIFRMAAWVEETKSYVGPPSAGRILIRLPPEEILARALA